MPKYKRVRPNFLVFRHFRIHFFRPSLDSPGKVVDRFESALHQKLRRFLAATAHFALHNNLLVRVQFSYSLRQVV